MRPTHTTIQLGGQDYRADLRLGEIRELEEIAGEGIFRLLGSFSRRVKTYSWAVGPDGLPAIVEDLVPEIGAKFSVIREVIRLGLIGGGMAPIEAEKLVRRHVDGSAKSEAPPMALEILAANAYGAPEDATEADPRTAAGTETVGSTSPTSTETPPSSAIAPATSTPSASGNGSRSSRAGTRRTAPARP